MENGECLQTFKGHGSIVTCCIITTKTVHLSAMKLFSGSWDNCLKCWSFAEENCVFTFKGHKSYIWCCVLSKDENFLFSGSSDQTLKCWDLNNGDCIQTYEIDILTN
jgi:WD40 repeat protein